MHRELDKKVVIERGRRIDTTYAKTLIELFDLKGDLNETQWGALITMCKR